MPEPKDGTKSKNIMQAVIALILTLSFVAMDAAFVYRYLAEGEMDDFAVAAIMSLINFTGVAVGYYVGSSKGSADKNTMIESKL
jgi:hypothetical protein